MEKGYAAATIDDIVALAGAARATFYKHFENKEDAFLELLERGFGELLDASGRASLEAEGGVELEACLDAILAWVESQPASARACLVEAPAAGERALALQLGAADSFAKRLRRAAPDDSALPERFDPLLVDGVWAILRFHLASGRESQLPRLQNGLAVFLRQSYSKP